jgi:hypothetical protein
MNHRSLGRKFAAVATSVGLLSGGLVAAATPASAAAGCTGTTENPHYSTGAGGNIVKSRTTCAGVTSAYVLLILFRCPHSPTGAESTWQNQGCREVASGYQNIRPVVGGKTYTTYAPAPGTRGVRGAGFYVGCNIVSGYNSAGSQISHQQKPGPIVHLSS